MTRLESCPTEEISHDFLSIAFRSWCCVCCCSAPPGPASRSGSSTRSTARVSSRRPACSTSTTTASSTSSAADTWYQAPDWKPHHVRDVQRVGTYYNDFATLPLDVNGDGNTDFVTVSYFGKNVGWVENPGKTGATWTFHELDVPGPSEAAAAVDLTGDGIPDVLPNVVNTVAWYEVARKADGKGLRHQEARLRRRGRQPRRGLGRCQRRRPRRPAHAQGLVRGPRRPRPTRPGPGTPTGTWARPASRSWPATSMATASPTSSTAWATTTASSG